VPHSEHIIPSASAGALASALRRGELGSEELLDCYLDRIARLDPAVHSVVTLDAEAARTRARRADIARAAGQSWGPLHGLPITVKDAIETAGLRSTGGATELAEHVPETDATAVARLRAAGAIVFGKTNLPAWSGDMQTFNDLFGTTNNPWEPTDSPGGSSGGAAAAVACGFTAFELGTDIGGSIRIPSHLCGTFGLRPSHGLVPQDGYLAGSRRSAAPLDVNVLGPIARSAADLDLLLDVLVGADSHDVWRVRLPPMPDGRPLRIGFWFDDPFCRVDAAYLAVLRELADRLSDAGCSVAEAHPAVSFVESFETYWTLLGAANGLNEDTGLSHRVWLETNEARLAQRAAWHEWFGSFDVLICPVLAVTRYPHDHSGTYATRTVQVNGRPRTHVDVARWTGLVGALGLPVAVAPAGAVPDGRPVGVQIIAARWHDRTATGAAALVAELTSGFRSPPGFG
jgi:amidase